MITCKCCRKEFPPKRKTSVYCSEPCRTFYQLVGMKLPEEMLQDAALLSSEDDYKLFVKSYFYMKNGNLNYQLLESNMLSAHLGIDYLKYANQHNDDSSVNNRVLRWLHSLEPQSCLTCGNPTSLEIKKSIPAFRKYCSEACYAKSMESGGQARKVINEAIESEYGVRNVFLVDSIKKIARERSMATCLEKYGSEYILQNDKMHKHITSFNDMQSKAEKELSSWLTSLGVKHHCSDYSVLKGKDFSDGGKRRQIDIYCPEHKLAIEYNGLYWHSDAVERIYRNFHLEKTEFCEEQGIQLIHIWEDEWLDNPGVVKGMLAAKLGLSRSYRFARKSKVREITYEQSSAFLNRHHIQGSSTATFYYGLFIEDVLVGLMLFTNRGENNVYELTRYASDNVQGGFGKLLKHFVRHHNPGNIYSFGDRCVVSRFKNIYLSNGFVETEIQKPDYKYHKPGVYKRYHKFNFRKEGFKRLGYEIEGKTESQLAKEAGLVRIWNCGLIRYELNFNNVKSV